MRCWSVLVSDCESCTDTRVDWKCWLARVACFRKFVRHLHYICTVLVFFQCCVSASIQKQLYLSGWVGFRCNLQTLLLRLTLPFSERMQNLTPRICCSSVCCDQTLNTLDRVQSFNWWKPALLTSTCCSRQFTFLTFKPFAHTMPNSFLDTCVRHVLHRAPSFCILKQIRACPNFTFGGWLVAVKHETDSASLRSIFERHSWRALEVDLDY